MKKATKFTSEQQTYLEENIDVGLDFLGFMSITHVKCDITGNVDGTVYGDIEGEVWGYVWGDDNGSY
jgi:hypothetical protein